MSFYSVESENWSAVSESRSRLLFVLAHNYDNSSWTSQAPLPTKTIICQYSGPPDSELQFYKLIIKKIRHFFLLTICYIYFIHLKKLWQPSQHEASLPPHFSTFLWQILSRSRPQILKYFKQKPQLNSPQIFYFNIHFWSCYFHYYDYHHVQILNYLLIQISIISGRKT